MRDCWQDAKQWRLHTQRSAPAVETPHQWLQPHEADLNLYRCGESTRTRLEGISMLAETLTTTVDEAWSPSASQIEHYKLIAGVKLSSRPQITE